MNIIFESMLQDFIILDSLITFYAVYQLVLRPLEESQTIYY